MRHLLELTFENQTSSPSNMRLFHVLQLLYIYVCVCACAITLTTRMGVYCRESCDNTSSDNSHGAHVNIRVQKVSNA